MGKTLQAAFASWQTTGIAILQALIVIFTVIVNAFDNDPTTVADWNKVVIILVALLNACGLFVTRDADKSDQESGIRPEK
jgi:hypothetical protein